MNLKMNTNVRVLKLIDTLKQNKDNHKKMYLEAVTGFKKDAKRQLERLLAKIGDNEVADVYLSVGAPKDMSSVYDTAIKMLNWTQDETIELDANTFRNLVMDEWDWMQSWLASNARYSETADVYGKSKGYIK